MNIKKALFHATTILLVIYAVLKLPMLMIFGAHTHYIASQVPPEAIIRENAFNVYNIIGYIIVALGIIAKIAGWKSVTKEAKIIDIVINIIAIGAIGFLSIIRCF